IQKFDALVLGAGAAGLKCDSEAGKRGRRVAVMEQRDRIGKKIIISGGGRCNFPNIDCKPENFISANPHFAKSALARYTPSDSIALHEKQRIPYHEKTVGQLVCDRSAHDVTNMLEAECRQAGVQIFTYSKIREVQRTDEFVVHTEAAEFHAAVLVVATGGLSIPKIGATALGYDLARQFHLKIQPTKPALVPLVLGTEDQNRYCDLTGVSAEVIATSDHHSFREKMLITHKGLSGPAILQVSSYWNAGKSVQIDLAPERDVTAAIREARTRNLNVARSAFQEVLPNRMAVRWLDLHAPSTWSNQALAQLEQQVHEWRVTPADPKGYAKPQLPPGGVHTQPLSPTP